MFIVYPLQAAYYSIATAANTGKQGCFINYT